MLEQKIEALTDAINLLTAALSCRVEIANAAAAAPTPAVEKPKAEAEVKKDEPKAEAEVKKDEPKAEAEVKKDEPKVEEKKSAATYDQVRAAMLELNTKKGREATVSVLKAVGVETVPQLQEKPELFEKVIELSKAGLQ